MNLAVILGVSLSACSTLPPAPTGQLYLIDKKLNAYCSDLQSASTCPTQTVQQLTAKGKIVGFDTTTWKGIQDYIDALIRYARNDSPAIRWNLKKTEVDPSTIDKRDAVQFLTWLKWRMSVQSQVSLQSEDEQLE